MDRTDSASHLDRDALRKLRMIKNAIDSDRSIVDYIKLENSHELVNTLTSYFDRLKGNYRRGSFVDLDVDTINLLSWVIYDPDLHLVLPELAIRKLAQDFKLIYNYSRCVGKVYRLVSMIDDNFSESTLKNVLSDVIMQIANTGVYDMEHELHAVFIRNLLRLLNKNLKHDYVFIKAINDLMQVQIEAVV